MTTDDFDDAIHTSPDDNLHNANNTNHAAPPGSQDAAQQQPSPGDTAAARGLGDDFDPQLFAMRQRVLLDSARWRASLPPLDGLAAQVRTLSAERRAQGLAQAQPPATSTLNANNRRRDRNLNDDSTVRMDATTDAQRTPDATGPRKPARLGALRGVLAGVAALVVVALLAGVLIALRGGHGSVGAPGAKHATPTTAPKATPTTISQGPWQMLPQLGVRTSPPVIAPSNPQVVYDATMSGSIERSADQGASWQTLPMPSFFPANTSPTWEDLFVSPLDANVVYAMANLTDPNGGSVTCPTPYSLTGSHALAGNMAAQRSFASAQSVVPCETQVISVDGGQHWRILTLPFGGRLGSANSNITGYKGATAYSPTPQAQGSRLYSYADKGYSVYTTGYRLATSVDGGLTWQTADGGLTAHGLQVCWYATTPTGSTVFAVASTNCDPAAEAPQSFWRSDNAGGNWRQLNMPSGVFTTNLTLTATATPTLYLMAPIGVPGHGFNLNVTPSDIYASVDGGQTWKALPTKGITGNPAHQIDTGQTFVALPNGTLVAPFYDSSSNNATTPFYSWKPGYDAWTLLPANQGSPVRLFRINSDAGGSKTIWLLNDDLGLGIASQAAYQVYTLVVNQ
ncbi:MAG TPA: hypothetical protein VMV29_16495 [Ktedonobacterales bacterium]|nr:hypothetical protein [Ktedonobacterales bacterium]